MKLFNLSVILLILSTITTQTLADTDKYALVFGNNRGHDPQKTLKYAEDDARKVHQVLVELGSFDEDNAKLLVGADADLVWRTLYGLDHRIRSETKARGKKALLLIYYSGHAEGENLELGDSSMALESISQYLKSSSADVRVAIVDSCLSGKLVKMKGGRRGPHFGVRHTDDINSSGYAIITSSADNELSQESSELRGAFFTHFLVSALRGAGDNSKDGKITLNEAYRHAYVNTLARTNKTIGGRQHPMYEFNLQGRGEIVLTQTDRASASISLQIPESGRLVLVDDHLDQLSAELEVVKNQTAVIAVRPGAYRAYLLTEDNAVRESAVYVEQGQNRSLGWQDFETTTLDMAVPKGGLFKTSHNPTGKSELRHQLAAFGTLRRSALEGGSLLGGAAVGYRFSSLPGLEPALRAAWSRGVDTPTTPRYDEFSALIGLGYVHRLGIFSLRVQAYAGYEYFYQKITSSDSQGSHGLSYLGLAGAQLRIKNIALLAEAGAGGRLFHIAQQGAAHRLDLQAAVGIGWMFDSHL